MQTTRKSRKPSINFIASHFLMVLPFRHSITGIWWVVFHERHPIAFAGVIRSTHAANAGYLCRVGVLRKHWGQALQLRLMRALEFRVRKNGWSCIVSDTTDNIASANNIIRAGYRLYRPKCPWARPSTLYWRKSIK